MRTIALMLLGCTALPAFAQDMTPPDCAVANYNKDQDIFTVVGPVGYTLNQQCLLTVLPANQGASQPARPMRGMPQYTAGNYVITLTGGGGGGGSGLAQDGVEGGGGGAGAAPFVTTRYLAPGIYRLTLGMGGDGGRACQTTSYGGRGTDGNPTALSMYNTFETIAGFPGAESWTGSPIRSASFAVASGRRIPGQSDSDDFNGGGGIGVGLQSNGGRGAHATESGAMRAQDGGKPIAEKSGLPGTGSLGGGGGAGYGNGGDGQTTVMWASKDFPVYSKAWPGQLGGGGGGGASGEITCGSGAPGGHGFVAIRPVR